MKLIFKTSLLLVLLSTCNSIYAQKFKPIEEIPEGKALVYIYRSSRVGAFQSYRINANDEKVSESLLHSRTYLVYFAEPGRYTFWGQKGTMRLAADLDVEAGKTYYVRGDCCELIIPDSEKAKKEIVKCKLSKK